MSRQEAVFRVREKSKELIKLLISELSLLFDNFLETHDFKIEDLFTSRFLDPLLLNFDFNLPLAQLQSSSKHLSLSSLLCLQLSDPAT